MEKKEKYECNFCLQKFGQKYHLKEHQKNRPAICIEFGKRINIVKNRFQQEQEVETEKKLAEQNAEITKLSRQKAKIEQKLAEQKIEIAELAKKEAEYKAEIAKLIEQKAEVEKKLVEQKAEIVEKHEMVVDQLIYSKPAVRERKKVVKDIRSRKKIPAFRSVLENAKEIYKLDDLKIYIRLDGEGDIMIFKDLFIDRPDPSERCINTLDSARDKYEIFDGNHWITMKLRDIVDIVMDSLANLYYPVLNEKHAMLDNVDQKYPRWSGDDSIIEQNIQAYNEVTDMFISATEHHASLLSKKEDLHNEIKNGIQGLLLKMKN